MRAAIFDEKGIKVKETKRPEPEKDEVLIEVKACGVCGTDIHILEGEFPSSPPVILGHEISGKVLEKGKKVKSVDVGDKVTVNPNIPCETCSFCKSGKPHLCDNWTTIGIHLDGGFAEFMTAPEKQIFTFDRAEYLEGALSEPIACSLRGINRLNPEAGESALVAGGGAIGLLLLQLLKLSGVSKVYLSEPIDERREMAENLGADRVIDPKREDPSETISDEIGKVDNAIEATGNPQVFGSLFDVVKKGGKILQFGVCPPDAKIKVSPYQIYCKEIKIMGSFTNPFTQLKAVNLIESGKMELKPLITDTFDLDKIDTALKLHESNEGIKMVIRP